MDFSKGKAGIWGDIRDHLYSPGTNLKRYEKQLGVFQAKLKQDLHDYHQYKSVIVYLTADWEKLEAAFTEVKPVLTPWQEINQMQEVLFSQFHNASDTISYQNIGNTARHLLKKLADIVFIPEKHTAASNTFDLGPENFKNRLWAFVLYKVPPSNTGESVRAYAKSLLEASDKAIDLSNSLTHALHADSFVAQSCVVSAITTVHFVKLVFDRADP